MGKKMEKFFKREGMKIYENGDVFMTKEERDNENKVTYYAMIFLSFAGMAIGCYCGLNGGVRKGISLERSAWINYISTHSVDEVKKIVDSFSNK